MRLFEQPTCWVRELGLTTDLNMQLRSQVVREAELAADLHMQLKAEAFQEAALKAFLTRDCILRLPDDWSSNQLQGTSSKLKHCSDAAQAANLLRQLIFRLFRELGLTPDLSMQLKVQVFR